MNLLEIFKKIGHVFGIILGFAKSTGLTDEVVQKAIDLVKEAAVRFADNGDKHNWAVAELKKVFPVSDSIANFAIELGVQELKRLEAQLGKKLTPVVAATQTAPAASPAPSAPQTPPAPPSETVN